MSDDADVVESHTRERLLDAGMRLFAEKGFRGTTVGEIEAAVGLQPRRGALYKHFTSKQALLEAAVQRHFDAIGQASGILDEIPLTDLRTEALFLGRWLLDELQSERDLTRMIEHDGDRMPELRDQMRDRISDAGYRAAMLLIDRWATDGQVDGLDHEAMAISLLGPLINFRRSTWTFGVPPLGLDDERMIEGWAELCVRLMAPGDRRG